MFRYVADQARSVGTFVSKVLSPRAAAADHAMRSGLDTALSSSAFDEKLEEAAAESTPRVIAGSAVLGGTGSAFLEAALEGEDGEGSQLVAKPETPKSSPPTPKGAEGGPEAAVSKGVSSGVIRNTSEVLPETPNAQIIKGRSKKKGGVVMGEEVETSVRGMKRLADLSDEKPAVKRGKVGGKGETVGGAKAGRGDDSGGGKKEVHEGETIRTPEVKKQTPKAGRKVTENEGNSAREETGKVAKGETKRTVKQTKKVAERKPKTGTEGSKAAEIGLNEQPTPRAKKAKSTAETDRKEASKGGDKRMKTTAKRQEQGTPKAKGGVENLASAGKATAKPAGVKRKMDDEERQASGGGKGKAAKRGGGRELEGNEYLRKRIKVSL